MPPQRTATTFGLDRHQPCVRFTRSIERRSFASRVAFFVRRFPATLVWLWEEARWMP